MVDVDLLNKYLHECVVTVTFTKANGDERVMRATLKSDLLPVTQQVNTTKSNPNTARVYDIDVEGWRSFRYDSIREIKV